MHSSLRDIHPNSLPALFEKRPPWGHKGSFGTLGILGGGPGMTGAALLAARAALKLGAGKVLVGFAQETSPLSCDPLQPELMLHDAKHWLMSDLPISAWIAGCGLGQTSLAITLLNHLLEHHRNVPVVLDADGLNLLAQGRVAFTTPDDAPLILTPHPAEAGRLLACSAQHVQADRPGAALALCQRYRAWIVLKGAESLVCRPDGHILRNTSGNVGLATAGTGDVLAGMLGSLIAQNIDLEQAVTGAVWLHGAAADLLVSRGIGPIGLTAGELANAARELRNRPY